MRKPKYFIEEELLDWYSLTPSERWRESRKLWDFYISMGGSLDPEPDTQSPFYSTFKESKTPPNGRTGLRVLRRSGV
jgi:hypothetical protein